MARDSEDRKGMKERREEEDAKDSDLKRGPATGPISGKSLSFDEPSSGPDQNIDRLLERGEPMIDQLNNLYNQFMAGVERAPPIAQRKQLDELFNSISQLPKNTPALRFRYDNVYSKYRTFRDRWDKLMRDLEDGKARRVVKGAPKGTSR